MEDSNIPIFNDPVQLEVRNQVLKLQSDEIVQGRHKIDNMDKDLNTLRRQVEIIQDSSLRKSNTLFILQTVLTFLILLFIPMILAYKQYIDRRIFTYIAIVLSILFALILFYNLRSVWNRDPNRFSIRNFGDTMKPSKSATKCVSNLSRRLSPRDLELRQRAKQLDTLDERLKKIEEDKKELEMKTQELDRKEKELQQQYYQQYPDDNIEKEIEKATALRVRF